MQKGFFEPVDIKKVVERGRLPEELLHDPQGRRCSRRSAPRRRSTRTSRPSCRRRARSGSPPTRPDRPGYDDATQLRRNPPMASTRDIRRRIKSVKNTRQITKAMELVAASKMKKAQQAALAGRPYANLLADVLAALANRIDETAHPFLVRARGEDTRDPPHHDGQGPVRAAERQPVQARPGDPHPGEVLLDRPQGHPVPRPDEARHGRRLPGPRPRPVRARSRWPRSS